MECRMSLMTQMEVADAIAAKKSVIIPTGATEAHGPHMPTDTDTHQVEHIAWLLAQRINALVAPPLAYGISKTFEYFPGTISLSIPTYQLMLFEIGSALVKQGFEHLIQCPKTTGHDDKTIAILHQQDLADKEVFHGHPTIEPWIVFLLKR